MKLATLARTRDPFSLKLYRENISRELSKLGVQILSFSELESVPVGCDLIWEPGLAGSRTPLSVFKDVQVPIVATVHGAAPFTVKWREYFPDPLRALKGTLQNYQTLFAWRWFREKLSAVITVSEFGAQEVSSVFKLPRDLIHPIHHGLAHDIFHTDGEKLEREPYLLLVAQYQPVKNIERTFEAYTRLSERDRPNLVSILPHYRSEAVSIKGVELTREGVTLDELARWYRGAMGFVLPSLRESFCMPILEAMACGCPVVTSNTTACAEVAGDAAMLVDPRSVDSIAGAMRRLTEDEDLRLSLRQKGKERAQSFTWQRSAERHLEVFKSVLEGA